MAYLIKFRIFFFYREIFESNNDSFESNNKEKMNFV